MGTLTYVALNGVLIVAGAVAIAQWQVSDATRFVSGVALGVACNISAQWIRRLVEAHR